MKFLEILGVVGEPEIADDDKEELALLAEDFLRAGGVLSLDDWKELSSDERSAFVTGGDSLRARIAVEQKMAMASVDSCGEVAAKYDSGQMTRSIILERALDLASEKVRT